VVRLKHSVVWPTVTFDDGRLESVRDARGNVMSTSYAANTGLVVSSSKAGLATTSPIYHALYPTAVGAVSGNSNDSVVSLSTYENDSRLSTTTLTRPPYRASQSDELHLQSIGKSARRQRL
jgi:hypothetical protein